MGDFLEARIHMHSDDPSAEINSLTKTKEMQIILGGVNDTDQKLLYAYSSSAIPYERKYNSSPSVFAMIC